MRDYNTELTPERMTEDERIIEGFYTLIRGIRRDGGMTLNKVPLDKCEAWLGKQKPEWSEADENMLKSLRGLISFGFAVDYCGAQTAADMREWLNTRLKSLGHLPNWKPGEEHLSALLAILNDPNNIGSQTCQLALSDLYEQLKKIDNEL